MRALWFAINLGAACGASASVLAASAVRVPAVEPAEAAERPNVVLILADDLGWGELGCYGHPRFKTPEIDRLAREGARWTQFYAPVPFCAPTRASLLTGRYPFRSGMTRNPAPDAGIDDVGLPASEVTLAEALRAAGYATAMVGKWHLGHRPDYFPTRHGFDEFLGILYSNDMRPVQLVDGERVVEYPVVQATLTRRYTERALDFIERHRDRPFFLYFAHAMPHKPLAASERFYKKSGAGLYGDALAELDWSVGQVLEKLKALGLEERTLVLFTSDNGPWFGGSTGGLRGMKGTTWEGGLRVPLIARWPGKVPAGHTCGELGIMMDLFATVLAAARVAAPPDRAIDGRDLLPFLAVGAPAAGGPGPHEALHFFAGARPSAVRSGRWKLHITPPERGGPPGADWVDPRAPDGVTLLAPYEQARPGEYPGARAGDAPRAGALFDLEADPAESRDAAEGHRDVVERLRRLHDGLLREVEAVRPQERQERQERQEKARRF